MLIWLLSEVWHGIYSWEVTVDLKRRRFASFERRVWEHFPLIYKNEKKKRIFKNVQSILCLHIKNCKWFPSTEYPWGFLFPCEISELAWKQLRAWAQTARAAQRLAPGKSPGELPLSTFPVRSEKVWRPDPTEVTAFTRAKISSRIPAIKVRWVFLIPFLFLAGSRFPSFPSTCRYFRPGCKL